MFQSSILNSSRENCNSPIALHINCRTAKVKYRVASLLLNSTATIYTVFVLQARRNLIVINYQIHCGEKLNKEQIITSMASKLINIRQIRAGSQPW